MLLAAFSITFTVLSSTIVRAQGSWTTESSEGFSPRALLASVVVDGKIYAIGGSNEATSIGMNTFEVYDPSTSTWSTPTTTGTFTPRAAPAAVAIGSKIYVMGGYVSAQASNTFEVFDTQTNEWSTPITTGTFSPRGNLGAVVVDGKIYAIGGGTNTESVTTLEVFDPATSSWSTPVTTGTFTPRYGFATGLIDGKIYTFGGWIYKPGGSSTNMVTNAFEVFDPSTDNWSTPAATGTSTARSGISGVVFNRKLYTIGNVRAGNFIEVFDPADNSWSSPVVDGAPTLRAYSTSALAGNRIYVLGGRNLENVYLNTHESLTLETSGVDDAESTSLDIELFPNPTRGEISLRGATTLTSRVVVTSTLGERVLEIPNSRAGALTIDLSKLAAGRYFVSLVADGKATTRMIVRE